MDAHRTCSGHREGCSLMDVPNMIWIQLIYELLRWYMDNPPAKPYEPLAGMRDPGTASESLTWSRFLVLLMHIVWVHFCMYYGMTSGLASTLRILWIWLTQYIGLTKLSSNFSCGNLKSASVLLFLLNLVNGIEVRDHGWLQVVPFQFTALRSWFIILGVGIYRNRAMEFFH